MAHAICLLDHVNILKYILQLPKPSNVFENRYMINGYKRFQKFHNIFLEENQT